MKIFLRYLLLVLFVPQVANSQPAMFSGWDEFCGIRVIVTPNPQNASAAIDAYGPVIYADPGVMGNWTMSRVFTLAHECGHHRSRHVTPEGMWFRNTQFWATRHQELEADCWAARALRATNYSQDIDRMIRQFASQGGRMQGNYPSGLERAYTIAECAGVAFDISPYLSATVCMTQFGHCPLLQALERGTMCLCQTYQGPIHGVAQ